MNVFLDTSALFKLYHREPGTNELDTLLKSKTATHLYISEVAVVEFYSATTKKLRMNEIDLKRAHELINLLEADIDKYNVVKISCELLSKAKKLVLQHSQEGLRAIDAIQVASAIAVSNEIAFVKTFDDLQLAVMNLEGLKTML